MATELRNTGISVVGAAPWGTHFCHFYETKQDLLDTLVPYFKAGLESKEFCLWVVSDSDLITVEEAKAALAQAVSDLDRHLADENIEILNGRDWYFKKNVLNLDRVASAWDAKLKHALARGYDGLRASGDTFWLAEKDWKDFFAYEKQINDWLADQRMTVLCTYPLAKSGSAEVLDVVKAHQFVIARRRGEWEIIETPELVEAKAEIKRLNEELEQRVVERTRELAATNVELRREITERKHAEDELRQQKEILQQQKEILQQIFDHIPVMINFVGADGRIKLVNREWERTLGWSLDEIQQQNLDVFAECYPDLQYRRQVLKFVAEAKGEWADLKVRVRDGRVIDTTWVRVHLSDGTSIGIGRDITERKGAEDALRRSEDRLRLVVDTIPAMVFTALPDGSVDFVNQRWLQYLGLSLEDVQGWGWGPTIHPEDRDTSIDHWRSTVAAGQAAENELRVRRADGVYRWILGRFVPLRDESGKIVKWYGVSTDIDDRKLAEEKLKQSESQLAEAQRLAHVGSWEWDLRSNAVTWSEELYRIFGLQPGKIKVRGDARQSIHPEDRDLVWSIVQKSVKSKEPYSFYYRILRPDGDERIAHSRGHIVSDESGEPIRVFGATQDVTDLKQAEEKLKATSEQLRALSARLQSAREEVATRIAREIHDELGSSLTRLKWDLELMSKEHLQAEGHADVARLRQKITAMSGIVDDTVDVVRRISAELRPSVLDDLGLAAALRLHTKQFQDRTGIVTNCDCFAENLGLNRQQSTTLFRVFEEALTNVMRHAGATKVDVSLKRDNDDDLVLTIRDNGRGIAEAEMLYPSSLGLLGMRERVNLIGGELNITGTEGEGTMVTVRLSVVS